MMVTTNYLDVTTSKAFAVSSFIPVFVEPCKDEDCDHHHHPDQDQDHHQNHQDIINIIINIIKIIITFHLMERQVESVR